MKKTINVYSFTENVKCIKYLFTLCVFAMTFFISSDGFSQQNMLQSSTMTNPTTAPVTLQFLSGLDFDSVDPNVAGPALKSEHNRLSSTSGIDSEEVLVKTFLIESIIEPITNLDATPDVAISNAYPGLLKHIEDNNLEIDNVDDMVLDIALLLQ